MPRIVLALTALLASIALFATVASADSTPIRNLPDRRRVGARNRREQGDRRKKCGKREDDPGHAYLLGVGIAVTLQTARVELVKPESGANERLVLDAVRLQCLGAAGLL